MHDIDDETRKEVLGEALSDQLQAILEYVQDIPAIKQDVAKLEEDMSDLKTDMKVVKAVVTDQSSDLQKHRKELNFLKKKAA